MSQMMGGRGGGGMMVWWLGPVLITLLLLTASTAALYALFVRRPMSTQPSTNTQPTITALTPQEQAVIQLLSREGGQALQKDIARSLNISRLKTYRLVSSLKKRGVVTVEPWGKTNLVRLSRKQETKN